MSDNSVDIIIINFNGEKIIAKCLNSIFWSSLKPEKIVVFDNNSSDESVKLIEKNYPSILLIKSKKNIGFGRAINESLRHVSSKYTLVTNHDVLVEEHCIKNLLISIRSQKNIAITNPLIYRGWNTNDKSDIYSFGTTINKAGFTYYSPNQRVNCFSGACFMIKSDLLKKFKFENSFFLYYEEPELCIRLLKHGYTIARTDSAISFHLENYSSPQKRNEGIAFRQFYGVQNHWYMIAKHWPLGAIPYTLLINCGHLIFVTFFLIAKRQFKYLKIVLLAPYQFIRGIRVRKENSPGSESWYELLLPTNFSAYLNLASIVFKYPRRAKGSYE